MDYLDETENSHAFARIVYFLYNVHGFIRAGDVRLLDVELRARLRPNRERCRRALTFGLAHAGVDGAAVVSNLDHGGF